MARRRWLEHPLPVAVKPRPARAPARLIRVAVIVLVGAVLAVIVLVAMQRRLIYPASAGGPVSLAGFTAIDYAAADGLRLRGLYRAGAPGWPTVVFFHGNGDSLRGSAAATSLLVASGYGVLLPEYRGYGANPGRPSEMGLYADGRAALAWLETRGTKAADTVLIGNSLGSGVAAQMATEQDYRALVIISGFASLPEVIAGKLGLGWAGALIPDKFDNAAKLARVDAAVLILHGTADRVVPVADARRLARADPSATLRLFDGIGHELAYRPEAGMAVLDWLMAQNRPVRHRPGPRAPLINRA